MKIVITGANGQLGSELLSKYCGSAIPLTRQRVDIVDSNRIDELLTHMRPDVLINCAAYTAVDRAEADKESCFKCNALAVHNIAAICRRLEIRLVQLSTDYVFGGDVARSKAYDEADRPSPQSTYARTKLMGEHFACCVPDHLIIRTCGLYGVPGCLSFVNAIVGKIVAKQPISVVSDQKCSPSYTVDVADAIVFLIEQNAVGIFHIVNSGCVSWFEFAIEIAELMGATATISPITSAEYGAVAVRPSFSVLENVKYQMMSKTPLRTRRDALHAYISKLERKGAKQQW